MNQPREIGNFSIKHGIHFRPNNTHSSWSRLINYGSESVILVRTGKIKTRTVIEEAELDRLRERQIKKYHPDLNSWTKIQDQLFKIFDDKELTDEG